MFEFASPLVSFCWSAVTGGACYDALKGLLGTAFDQLSVYKKEGKEVLFEAELLSILDTNEEIKKTIADMAEGNHSTETTVITTGNIQAGGSVIVGSHNSVGSSK
ncbi:hypothetical protein [Endozoicomonas sp. ALC020]|uniref:hypothetical protein n=1 Tax=unclassified Endozoicomonas TaxID=2644528 RepID=UPI003BB15F6E